MLYTDEYKYSNIHSIFETPTEFKPIMVDIKKMEPHELYKESKQILCNLINYEKTIDLRDFKKLRKMYIFDYKLRKNILFAPNIKEIVYGSNFNSE